MGLSNLMEMAETYYNTSAKACSYLMRSLIEDGKSIQNAHIANVNRVAKSALVVPDLLGGGTMEMSTGGQPGAKCHLKKLPEGTGMFL